MNLNEMQNVAWKGLWITIVCEVWIHRNNIIFRHGKIDMEEVWSLSQLN